MSITHNSSFIIHHSSFLRLLLFLVPVFILLGNLIYPGHSITQIEPRFNLSSGRTARQLVRDEGPIKEPTVQSGKQLTIGYYVNWDETSFCSLKEHSDDLDILIPEWLHLSGPDGSVAIDDYPQQLEVTKYIRSRESHLDIMPLINNCSSARDEWQGELLAHMVANPVARKRVIDFLFEYVRKRRFMGISVDFENIPPKSQPALYQFMSELYMVFHPAGLYVSMNLPCGEKSYDNAKYSSTADYIILMTYDQHSSSSKPGPVASIVWFSNALKDIKNVIPREKLIIAIGNYAYDWAGGKHTSVKTFDDAIVTARESEGKISVDPSSLNPHFEYVEEDNRMHHVWFLDAVTAFNQMALSQSYGPRGYALWRLGSEEASIWNFFGTNKAPEESIALSLNNIEPGFGVDYEGKGDFLRITGEPKRGKRECHYDPSRGLIVSERIIDFPSQYIITRYGSRGHKLALTFDDGPDSKYTPSILAILKESAVPATFFIVGREAEKQPELIKREIAEGHEIGNHTFTHPNIADISKTQLDRELTATQHLLERVTGRGTFLFRPSYASDIEPVTPDQVTPLEQVYRQGYLVAGMKIDPFDWKQPGAGEIVSRTIKQVTSGKGNIILLHDSGGDRSQTVEALPKIIKELRKRGYEFVTVSDLLGKTRDEVMPRVSSGK